MPSFGNRQLDWDMDCKHWNNNDHSNCNNDVTTWWKVWCVNYLHLGYFYIFNLQLQFYHPWNSTKHLCNFGPAWLSSHRNWHDQPICNAVSLCAGPSNKAIDYNLWSDVMHSIWQLDFIFRGWYRGWQNWMALYVRVCGGGWIHRRHTLTMFLAL